MKTGVKSNILWSEIGSGEPGGTPPPRIPFVFVITRIPLNGGSLYRGSVPHILLLFWPWLKENRSLYRGLFLF